MECREGSDMRLHNTDLEFFGIHCDAADAGRMQLLHQPVGSSRNTSERDLARVYGDYMSCGRCPKLIAASQQTTPCNCESPGWCARHACNKLPHFHHLCRTNVQYFRL